MSYSRQTGVSPIPDNIVFYYYKENLFNKASVLSLYRAKNILDDKGNSQIENYAMTEDEMDAFELFARDATEEVFNIVMKMTTGLTSDPIFYDDTITILPGPIDLVDVYGFKIVDHDAYNENNLITIDAGVREYINYSILADWWSLVGHQKEYAEWLAKKEDMGRSLINKRLFQLKKALIGTY